MTSSLSLSLGKLGTKTEIFFTSESDQIILNDVPVSPEDSFSVRLSQFLDLFRPHPQVFFLVQTNNSIPTSAGLASSASGFAALVLALDELFNWKLDLWELSILARLGSGSACRSLYNGFVKWHAGLAVDGMDSYATPVQAIWPEVRIGLVTVSGRTKPISSREAMQQTIMNSLLYRAWAEQVDRDLANLEQAIEARDFELLGRTAETNALAMHATMIASWPPVFYWLPDSVEKMQQVWHWRTGGLPLYFTMDAGPNLKLIFESSIENEVRQHFPEVEIVAPFADH